MEANEQTWAVRSHPSLQWTTTDIPLATAAATILDVSRTHFTCFNHCDDSKPFRNDDIEVDFCSQATISIILY